ncbi:MAG: type II secretion system F family protein [Chloroflexota bacterium]
MTIITIGVFLAFLSVLLGLIVIAVGAKRLDNSLEQQRIQSFVAQRSDGLQARSLAALEGREFSEALIQRTLGAWLSAVLTSLSRYAPQQTLQETNRRLVIAGNPFNFRAGQFYGARVLMLIVGALMAFGLYRLNPSPTYLLFSLLLMLVFLVGPGIWLRAMMRKRQDVIRRGLPDALDMLSVITAAGLGFDQAMLRLGQTFKTPVGQEFARVVSEIEVGVSRKQALRDMQARVDIPELSSFVAVIVQSEQLGMSIADVLHSQAEQMRIYRQYRAKEIAQQLPARMMLPLALFIFPALLAVILGPFFPVLLEILQ